MKMDHLAHQTANCFTVNWSTTHHTETNVPVTSQGPLPDMLTGVHDNTFIHDVMLRAFGGG